ncbi:MAG: 2-C-methyl-D-erythritol 4-phosphate cytidylyltransferase [Clostridiales bacterium]|nr:2-C-methyl-D-erythritol 4-phosphate cytidylyltransferase [Clostridiales bacterium]
MKYSIGVIVCAAGKGARAGFDKNKLLVPFQGSTALEKTLSAFDFPTIDEIVITASQTDFAEISALCQPFSRTRVVVGGDTRFASVYNALQTVSSDIVLIHDGARPFVTREIIERCIHSVKSFGSGVCALPCTDTIAVAEKGKIANVPDRNTLWQIQTPQGFFKENLLSAYTQAFENAETTYTDDSSVFAAFCGKPTLCEGAKENIKLTHASDFTDNHSRCGFGVDTHAFGKEQTYITLGGVKIPAESGLIAHSDGDVLVHALMDALLSAAGLKDIGYYFPDTDEKWKNADSMKMLERVVSMLAQEGYGINNVSIAVQAEKPRLAKYIDEMKNRLSSTLKIDPTAVGITAGTNEGLGYVGEGKGITVHAYALLKK